MNKPDYQEYKEYDISKPDEERWTITGVLLVCGIKWIDWVPCLPVQLTWKQWYLN